MKSNILFSLLVLSVMLFAACGDKPAPQLVVETVVVEKEVEVQVEEVVEAIPTPMPTMVAEEQASVDAGGHTLPAVASRANRLIVKNADLQLTVEDTDVAIDRVTQVVGDVGGYIVSSRVWYQDWLDQADESAAYKYASITVGIPVDQFESTMRRMRDLAVTVDDERASGQDVTDEYVDLDSRLRNLKATRDRIREFLDQAKDVEEALRVNEELKVVEAEIEAVQGRMNYLFDRAAFSTITIALSPVLPDPPEKPTPTPTPAPEPWSATGVARDAGQTFTSILRVLVELGIWFSIVVLPFMLPPIALLLVVRYVLKRKRA